MRTNSSLDIDPHAAMGMIRDAMGRNVRRCGSAGDTPYTGVRDQIEAWYFARHCHLQREFRQWLALAKMLDDKKEFDNFYRVDWPYSPHPEGIYRGGKRCFTEEVATCRDEITPTFPSQSRASAPAWETTTSTPPLAG